MSRTPPSPTALRVAELSQNAQTPFSLRPDADSLRKIAEELDLSALRKLSFEGRLKALGRSDWQLEARLGATVVQPCVVTLEPVQTRIDVDVTRLFVQDYEEPEETEVEMAEDDRTEPLGAWIDPAVVMIEALALEIPEYPRADGAELGQAVYTKPGEAPMTDEDARPFAGLANLKDQLKDSNGE
ncbi:MAG: DUF177 domain-containing protein [Sulfitobacter litoralis]|jgi:uncharacterized metal-binding protein YceD (DUF177 family)|uniref:YceD family protein n=1 Tax=Sulfitobacter TaxID=60136 RepID=UPI001B56FCE6|nr:MULTISPECIES: DUF177 domain-containing protein [Sulfitobacter]MBQ0765754.1 DUF177 domain-containing protein [Sulfitobacter litoralis]|tara:strand:+ start:181 stop:735 length:555 start_codon:yes stop_codon:yes gene_type:complete